MHLSAGWMHFVCSAMHSPNWVFTSENKKNKKKSFCLIYIKHKCKVWIFGVGGLLFPYTARHSPFLERNWALATNSSFSIALSQNWDYLILQSSEFKISKHYNIKLQRYRDLKIGIW